MLLEIEAKNKRRSHTGLGCGRRGKGRKHNPTLKADFVKNLIDFDFGKPPFSLIFPGDLHFMEVESLIAFAGAPAEFRRLVK